MTATKQRPKNEGYRLIRPCAKCPFRTDVEPYIRPGRAREIAESLMQGAEFPCHETTVQSPDDDTVMERGPDSQFCAGALVTLEKQGYANQMMRIAERLGVYDASRLDMDSPVFDSLDEWVERFYGETIPTVLIDGEEVEYEHCGIVGSDCADPAGFSVGGGAMGNPDPPTCHPVDDSCTECGSPVCTECRAEPGDFGIRCLNCVEED